MKFVMVIYLFYLGGGGVTTVADYPSYQSCVEAGNKLQEGRGSVVFKCVEVPK